MESDNSEQLLKFYTGLTREYWDVLWQFLEPSDENILSVEAAATEQAGSEIGAGRGWRSKSSLEDQPLMTLMRFHPGRMEQDLAYQFGVCQSTISRLFIKWINYLYLRLGDVPIWPSWEGVHKSMPAAFKSAYPNTFRIIDGTELRCEVPSSLSLLSKHYSSYKSHTTLKGLIAIAPNGCFIFVSELYSGSISDRELTEECGFLDLLHRVPQGKGIMADRGFDIQDLLVTQGLILNIPPFKGTSVSLQEEDVQKTQKIARLRIHCVFTWSEPLGK